MKVLKRNQIIISVLALMLITVGYMSFSNNNIRNSVETGVLTDSEKMAGIGDAKLVSNNNVSNASSESSENSQENKGINSSEESKNVNSSEENKSMNSLGDNKNMNSAETEIPQIEPTSSTTYQADYFVSSRLERDKMYSQMLETYQGLVENANIASEQKNISTQEMTKINNKKNSLMIAENLIKNLGFEDVVIFVNDNSTSVVIKAEKLSEADIAQIQNIVCREIGVKVEDIHISVK